VGIPNELMRSADDVKLLPIIVLERNHDEEKDEYSYSTAIPDYTIDGWIKSHLLMKEDEQNQVDRSLFGMASNIRLISQERINKWGLCPRKGAYKFVTLATAYNMFRKKRNYKGKLAPKDVIYKLMMSH
jgi:hypothetical protein